MRKILTNNWILKLLALLFASIVWLVVVNLADPMDTKTFRNITVSMRYEEVVTDKGKTYQIVDGSQTVSVVVKAKRSILNKLTTDNIEAYADFREIELASLVPVKASVTGYDMENIEATATPTNIQVNIEDTASNRFPITPVAMGNVEEGYALGEVTVDPEMVTVSGPESVVSTIARVSARVDVSGLTKSSNLEVDLIFYDSEDIVVDKTLLTAKVDSTSGAVVASVEVLETKEVGFKLDTVGTPIEGYKVAGIKAEPQLIDVAGRAEDLVDLELITIPASVLDVTEAEGKIEKVINVTEYLPEGIRLVDETATTVAITIFVDRDGTKSIEMPVGAIEVINNPSTLNLEFSTTEDVLLIFEGEESDLETLSAEKISMSIDLRSYTKAGEFEVPVVVSPIEGCTLAEKVTIAIKLEKK